jgi:hypothetical protein
MNMSTKSNVENRAEQKTPSRPRLQLDFTPEAIARVDQLRELSHSKTNADVVRDALRLYEWFLRQQQENWQIQLVKGDKVREVELLLGGLGG